MDRDSVNGYVSPANYIVEGKLELLAHEIGDHRRNAAFKKSHHVGTPEQATQVGTYADGAIVGSALMARLVDGDRAGFIDLVGRFRSALPAG
jgi:tryptophan synthase alpha subunit